MPLAETMRAETGVAFAPNDETQKQRYYKVQFISGLTEQSGESLGGVLRTTTWRLPIAVNDSLETIVLSLRTNGVWLNSKKSDWVSPNAILRVWEE